LNRLLLASVRKLQFEPGARAKLKLNPGAAHVPIRMTVCVINDGLFVYAPVAPTKECLQLLQQLIDTYGPIQTIVLPSVAVEHKVNVVVGQN
jgi:hypothetical protein